MAMSMKAPEELAGGSTYLERKPEFEGRYLFCLNSGMEGERPAKGEDTESIDGFYVECEVKAGKHESRKFSTTYYMGGDHSDGGEFARKLIAAFCVATDLIKVEDLGKDVSFEVADAVGSFFVADLKLGKPNSSGKSFLNVREAFHIDDPRVKDFLAGKDIAAEVKSVLEGIPKENRHDAKYFEPIMKKHEPKKSKNRVTDDADFDDL